MAEDDDDGMLHSLLTTLPELEGREFETFEGSVVETEKETTTDDSSRITDGVDEVQISSSLDAGNPKKGDADPDDMGSLVSLGEFDDYSWGLASATRSLSNSVQVDESDQNVQRKSDPETDARDSSPAPAPPSIDVSEKSQGEPSSSSRPPRPPKHTVPLSSLLQHADELYALYPPTHPELHIAEIMGPNSVIFTWKEPTDSLDTDADDEAERLTGEDGVVLPYEESEAESEAESSDWEEEIEKKPPPRKRRRLIKRRPRPSYPHKPSRLRKTLRRLGFGLSHPLLLSDKKTVATGAVLVLGVAIAVYSMQTRNANGGRAGVGGLVELLGGGAGSGGRERWKMFGWTR